MKKRVTKANPNMNHEELAIEMAPYMAKAHKGLQSLDQPLTEKQRKFVLYYVRYRMSAMAAARMAGYANSGPNGLNTAGYSLLRNPKVKQAIAIEQAEYREASKITRKHVVDGIIEAIDMARVQADADVMIKGWKEIAKICGVDAPKKVEVGLSRDTESLLRELHNLPDDELVKMIDNDNVIDGEVVDG